MDTPHDTPPTPAEVRARGNRLRDSASLYLRQHASNPVDWRPWDSESLALALKQGKLLLVSSGYSSCHWCHVMAHEVFEDDAVAQVLNEHFVCIKLDREEHPGVDAALMDALQALTGSGGWPLNIFLTPDLRPFYGVSYVPREQFSALATELARLQRADPARLAQVGAELSGVLRSGPQLTPAPALDLAWLAEVAQAALQDEDKRHGGLATPMKFPTPPRWRFLLQRYRHGGDARVAEMLRRVLDAMAQGGIRDHLAGGFHRYTVDETWTVPHFEKMLYDNAQLAALYLEAGAALDEPAYSAVGYDTLEFLLREMRGPGGAFYSSFDADSGGVEGEHYVWTPEDLDSVAGVAEARALGIMLRVFPDGPLEGKCVITRRPAQALGALAHGVDEALVDGLWERWRAPLLDYRNRRAWPTLDKKVVTAWNGMALYALALAALHSGEARYLRAAQATAEYLWQHHRREDGGLWRASTEGARSGAGVLGDYAQLALGLLALSGAGGEALWLERACTLLDYALAHFGRDEGGYYLTADNDADSAPLGRQADLFDSVEPSGSAALLLALWRAAAQAGREDYRSVVQAQLEACAGLIRRGRLELAAWCELAEYVAGPYYTVELGGGGGDTRTEALRQAYGDLLPGHAVLLPVAAAPVPPTASAGMRASRLPVSRTALSAITAGGQGRPPHQDGDPPHGEEKAGTEPCPSAQVCEHGACLPPCYTPEELRAALLRGWVR